MKTCTLCYYYYGRPLECIEGHYILLQVLSFFPYALLGGQPTELSQTLPHARYENGHPKFGKLRPYNVGCKKSLLTGRFHDDIATQTNGNVINRKKAHTLSQNLMNFN